MDGRLYASRALTSSCADGRALPRHRRRDESVGRSVAELSRRKFARLDRTSRALGCTSGVNEPCPTTTNRVGRSVAVSRRKFANAELRSAWEVWAVLTCV